MATRVTAPDDHTDVADEAKVRQDITEPFMFTVRELRKGGVKIIWWYVAVLDDQRIERGPGEQEIEAEFFECKEAIEKLWFETDREVLRNAIDIIERTSEGKSDGNRSG